MQYYRCVECRGVWGIPKMSPVPDYCPFCGDGKRGEERERM